MWGRDLCQSSGMEPSLLITPNPQLWPWTNYMPVIEQILLFCMSPCSVHKPIHLFMGTSMKCLPCCVWTGCTRWQVGECRHQCDTHCLALCWRVGWWKWYLYLWGLYFFLWHYIVNPDHLVDPSNSQVVWFSKPCQCSELLVDHFAPFPAVNWTHSSEPSVSGCLVSS